MLRSAGSHARALLRRGGLVRSRCFGTVSPEQQLEDKLRGSIDGVQNVKVTDTSGGCGTMYDVNITADAFRGKSIVKQHQLVTRALDEHIKQWHGFTLNTAAPG